MELSIITPVKATNLNHLDWLNETLKSIAVQPLASECEVVIAFDDKNSSIDIQPVISRWNNIKFLRAGDHGVSGVSGVRNLAADAASTQLLLPLDADDKLSLNALEKFTWAWYHGGSNAGIVYSDVIMFGKDYQQVYKAPGYSFRRLLEHTFMTVGCLHRKADWARIGGWRTDMNIGYEDWEYWITMGENGVCGFHISDTLYWYRRNPGGRMSIIKSKDSHTDLEAKARLRDLHVESYNGRFTKMCCGSPVESKPRSKTAKIRTIPIDANRVPVTYTGPKKGSFNMVAPSGVTYVIPGTGYLVEDMNGKPGVLPGDVAYLKKFKGGTLFRVDQETIAPGKVQNPAPKVKEKAREKARVARPEASANTETSVSADVPQPDDPLLSSKQAFNPNTAIDEVKTAYVPDPADYQVLKLRKLDIHPEVAAEMLELEKRGKNRATAIAFLSEVASRVSRVG